MSKLIVTIESVEGSEEKGTVSTLQTKDEFVQTLSRVVQQVQHEELKDGKTIEIRDSENQPVGTIEVVGDIKVASGE